MERLRTGSTGIALRAVQKLLPWVAAHPRLVVGTWVLAALVLLPGTARLETINTPEIFFPKQSIEVEQYHRLLATFGNDQVLRVLASGDPLWTPEGLAWLGHLERALQNDPSVAEVQGPATFARQVGLPWPPQDPEALVGRLRSDPVTGPLDLAAGPGDQPAVTLLVVLASGAPIDSSIRAIQGHLQQSSAPDRIESQLVGLPVLDQTLNASSREIAQRFFPLLALFAIVLLTFAFRSARGVVLPLAFVAVCEAALFGPMGYLGVKMNLLTAVLAPLLFVISLATAVHLLIRCRDLNAQGLEGEDAVLATYRDKGWAVLWTGLTTLVGFGSLMVSPIVPVRSLGLWFGVGILIMTAAAFTLYPALLILWPGRGAAAHQQPFEPAVRVLGGRWARWAIHRRWLLMTIIGITIGITLVGAARLRVESNALLYLDPDHPLRAAVRELEANEVGTAAIELFLALPEGAGDDATGFRDGEALAKLSTLAATLRTLPEVYNALGPGDLMAAGLQRLSSAASPRFPGMMLGGPTPEQSASLARFVTEDGRHARITLFTPTVGSEILSVVESRARSATGELFPDASVTLTGQYTLLLGTQRKLLLTLAESFTLTTLGIFLILRFLLKTWTLALLAMPANLWPILVVLGLMGWTDTPLDIATVMVGSMILGLAVDDTLHTFGHYRHLAHGRTRNEAIIATLERTAPAYLLTGLILAAGFGVCALSSFAPTARFGTLAALGILLAVLADLFLLPATLAVTPKKALDKLTR